MDSGIFLLQSDNSLLRMSEQAYEAEELLQKMLADHPDLLAGDQIDTEAPRRWLFISREIGVPGQADGSNWWSLDHLFLDQDSVPTFVEVKRSSDTRARREVVAQMLDYAANATIYWPASRMRELYAQSCEALGVVPEEYLRTIFDEEFDTEAFWARADQNLRAGRVRLLFVSDRIPSELRRIVEFLNGQMNPAEILALEVKQYVGLGSQLRTLVPRVIGQTEVTKEKKRFSAKSQPEQILAIDEFSALFDQPYQSVVDRLIEFGNSSRFELRSDPKRKTKYVRFLAPDGKGDIFSIATDNNFWLNLQNHERLGEPLLKERLREILLPAFPKKQNQIVNSFAQNTYIGFPYDQISRDVGLAAIKQAIDLVEIAIFDESDIEQTENEGRN